MYSLNESSEEPEGALESDNELSVIMEDEAEILLSAASEDEPDEDVPPDEDEEEPVEDESDPVEDADSADEDIPDDDAEEPDEPENPVEEPMEDPTDEPIEEPAEESSEISEDLTPVPTGITLDEPVEEPAEEPSEEPVEEPADEPVEAPVEEPIEEPAEEPVEEPVEEPAEELAEEPEEEEPEELPPHQAGDFVQVTKDTWVFTDMDKTDAANRITSDLFVGVFVRDAVVQIEDVLRDANGDYWYKVRYLYGDVFKDGTLKWTAYGTVFVLAKETADTDKTSCTVTDYAYTKEQLQRRTSTGRKVLRSFSPTAMDGFTLKEI